jgi:hypothetical protein
MLDPFNSHRSTVPTLTPAKRARSSGVIPILLLQPRQECPGGRVRAPVRRIGDDSAGSVVSRRRQRGKAETAIGPPGSLSQRSSATPVTHELDTGYCASVWQPDYDRGALAMSGPTPSTVAVPDTTRRDGAARSEEKLLEHWEQPVGGRNRK